MLKQRVITALVLALVFLGVLFGLATPWFALLSSVALLVGAWEWGRLSALSRLGSAIYMIVVGLMMAAAYSSLNFADAVVNPESLKPLLLSGCIWWAVAMLWVQGYPSSAILWGSSYVRMLMGFFVLLPAWLGLNWLVTLAGGQWLVILVILTVASADIGAYFCGRAFGKRKLAPQVSPGKTLEGFAGGVVLVLIVNGAIIGFNPAQGHLWLQWSLIAVVTALTSVLGDLLESMVKRHQGVKDSGVVLPGHGGILDRIDSLTAALPAFALLYLLLIHAPSQG